MRPQGGTSVSHVTHAVVGGVRIVYGPADEEIER
jgi:hypothetical protein